ncbi:DNA/RNA non-specific endonuclease [Metabacillus sp. GX 13764]|uniref:DNA/RNA non-specific endonuclease n=1 Tax=Metabacillus kandeliae TaxID=2900151 RepID=UPI001E425024|nr:DNA/RNA non-specific endonuclease [Metabacillus kandeliae]MCD7035662.1 DNA/RNA non-specific endonuclease [Metabacillus kandeliae]
MARLAEWRNVQEELREKQQQEAMKRFEKRSKERNKMAAQLETKNPFEVDSPDRAAFRASLIHPRDGFALERIINRDDLFPISYLEAGLRAGKSVCRIEVRDNIGRILGYGTGFLVSPSLLLTNNHVLNDAAAAEFSLAQFNYELDLELKEKKIENFRIDPKRFFLTDEKLDYTLVAIEETSSNGTPVSHFGYLPLYAKSGKALVGECASIIQHPSGAPKSVALRDNQITDVFDDFIHYSSDTKEGSSGSPVMNDEWNVIALHHSGVPDPDDSSKFIANEGVRISSLVKALSAAHGNLPEEMKKLADFLLKDMEPEAEKAKEEILVTEVLNKDHYKDAKGYDPDFLGKKNAVPHPDFKADLESDITPVEGGGKVLDYTHFSIVMSKSRRIAFYTAVNIDGSKIKDVPRKGDKWYFDPRIDQSLQCGPELYKNNPLDRGHLVRRRDPDWGPEAEKANQDTFHFTNCSPQHSNLNQKTWLELEDYLLSNAENEKMKATVFTGPVFREDDLVYRGVKIPAEFWKVAVMVKSDGSLSATAYLQSQKNLIGNLEFAYGPYKTYQIPVAKVETLTGLNFKDLKKYDPIGNIEASAGYEIQGSADIKL